LSSFQGCCFLFTGAGTVDEKLVTVTVKTPYCLRMSIQEVRISNAASATQCTDNLFRLRKYSSKTYRWNKIQDCHGKSDIQQK